MISALMLAASLAAGSVTDSAPPIHLWLSSDGRFRPGDRPRAYVKAAEDGYLVVLRADAQGRVRVLFPAEPSDDNFIHGGRKLEIRWPNAAEATYLGGRPAEGTVVAVWSPDPFKFDQFVRNDHWDYRVLGATKVDDDPEAGLIDIADRMSGQEGAHLDSDVATYSFGMWRGGAYGGWGYPGYSRFRVSLLFGSPYYGLGYYRPFFSDPFCYDPFWGYDALSCGYGYGFGYGFGAAYYRAPIYYGRPFYVRSQTTPRFVVPRDRVRLTPIQQRARSQVSERSPSLSSSPRVRTSDRAMGRGGWSRPSAPSRGVMRGGAAPRSRRH